MDDMAMELSSSEELGDDFLENCVPENFSPAYESSREQDSNKFSDYKKCVQSIEELGRGGFGKVTKVLHELDRTYYAIKQIKVNCQCIQSKAFKEVEILAKLNHKNVISYKHSWLEEGMEDDSQSSQDSQSSTSTSCNSQCSKILPIVKLYIMMGLCERDLDRFLEDRNKNSLCSSFKEVRNLGYQILKAIQYIHSQNIIHHDINPKNIFIKEIDKNIQIKLGDFGLACSQPKIHSEPIGLPYYASPEQGSSCNPIEWNCGKKGDIFSFGMVLLEIMYPIQTKQELTSLRAQILEIGIPEMMYRDLLNEYKEWANILKKVLISNANRRPPAKILLQRTRMFLYRNVERDGLVRRINDLESRVRRQDELLADQARALNRI